MIETKTYKVWVSGGGQSWIQFETESLSQARAESKHWNNLGYYAWIK